MFIDINCFYIPMIKTLDIKDYVRTLVFKCEVMIRQPVNVHRNRMNTSPAQGLITHSILEESFVPEKKVAKRICESFCPNL